MWNSILFGSVADPDMHHDPNPHGSASLWEAGSGSGSTSKWKGGSLRGVILKNRRVQIWGKVSGGIRIRIRIRIRVKSRIRIRIRIRVKSRIRICIHIQVKSRIRIRIKVMRILNAALWNSCSIDGKGNSMEGILDKHASRGYWTDRQNVKKFNYPPFP